MSTRYERRSREAPMDFEWTNKDRDVIGQDSPFRSAIKRSHTDMAAPNPPFPQPNPSTPSFGANRDVPFIFQQPTPNSTPTHPWLPPPTRASPQRHTIETPDVNMLDASPPKREEPSSGARAVATGAMTRVFRARQKHKERPRSSGGRHRTVGPDEDDNEEDDEDDPSENDQPGEMMHSPRRRRGLQKSYSEPVTTTANHHYTLHMPTPSLSHSDIPYVLLGYLQFFFNLSLVLGFLYLAFHFLLNVQKDVEQKMTEYTLESLQEIIACERLYTDNFCASTPSPIIVMQCHEWKACMERDATIVKRTKLLAELVGEVINGFMEPITWRTLVFTLTSLSMGIVLVNTLLTFYRARHAPANTPVAGPPAPAPSFPMYPPPYWGQTQIPSHPYMLRPGETANEMRGSWSAPYPEGDDTLDMPSRRRRITEDNAIKVR